MSINTTKSRIAVNRCTNLPFTSEISTSTKAILPFFSSSNEKDIIRVTSIKVVTKFYEMIS